MTLTLGLPRWQRAAPNPLQIAGLIVALSAATLVLPLCVLKGAAPVSSPATTLTKTPAPVKPATPAESVGLMAAIARLQTRYHPSYDFLPTANGFVTHLATGIPALIGRDAAITIDDPTRRIDFALSPEGIGRQGVVPLATGWASRAGAAVVTGAHLTQHLGALTARYDSSNRGLEQTFVVNRRPSGSGPTFSVDLRPSEGVTTTLKNAHRVQFSVGGELILTYGALRATDAAGATVPTSFALRGGDLRIVVADRGATYPLTIDPTWSSAGELGSGGYSISTSHKGTVVLVGEPWNDDPTETVTGAGEVFLLIREPDGQWASTAFWAPSYDPTNPSELQVTNGYFGAAVAVSSDGKVGVVSAPGLAEYHVGEYAFIFDLSLNSDDQAVAKWAGYVEPATTTHVYAGSFGFGASVAVYHDSPERVTDVFVGAPSSSADTGVTGETDTGVVYEYSDPRLTKYSNGNYSPDEMAVALYGLPTSPTTPIEQLGTSIALSPNHYVYAGAPSSNGGAGDAAGAMASWDWQPWNVKPSKPSDSGTSAVTYGAAAGDELGASVSASPSGSVVAAGEPGAVDPSVSGPEVASGAVALFDVGGSASPADIVAHSAGDGSASSSTPHAGSCPYAQIGPVTGQVAGEAYGTSVAVSDDGTTLLVGAPIAGLSIYYDAPGSSPDTPYAYVEYSADASWTCIPADTEQAFPGTAGTYFGESVAMAGNQSYGFVGAPTANVTSFDEGYSFELIGPGPATRPTISGTPPNGIVGHSYSYSFSIGGNPTPTVSITSGTLPRGLALDGATVSGTPTMAGSSKVTLTATNSAGLRSERVRFTVKAVMPRVTRVSPSRGTTFGGTWVTLRGTALTRTSVVSFGATTASFSVKSGREITAIAPAGSGTVLVTVTTPGGTSAESKSTTFTYGSSDVRVKTSKLPHGTKGKVYSTKLASAGGSRSHVWKIASGNLPAGVKLSSSGAISGKPTVAGRFKVTVMVESGGTNDTVTLKLTIAR